LKKTIDGYDSFVEQSEHDLLQTQSELAKYT